eukprot:50549-Eustigmatos_ZCMA.PRE.1
MAALCIRLRVCACLCHCACACILDQNGSLRVVCLLSCPSALACMYKRQGICTLHDTSATSLYAHTQRPGKRIGHIAMAVGQRLYVYGGRNILSGRCV